MARRNPIKRLLRVVWGDWQTNDLWQHIVKCVVAGTVAMIVAIHPAVVAIFGTSTFLVVQTTIFAHPGQRLGKMIESLLMVIFGSLLGLAWSLLGLYLSSLVVQDSQPAAYTIRALFFLVTVLFHGLVRSSSPRLFVFVLLALIASTQVLLGASPVVTKKVFTTVYYPILAGAGILLAVNLFIFPELSSSYLGSSTIDTLEQTVDTLNRATHWFITPGGNAAELEQHPNALRTTNSKRSKAPLKQERAKRKGHIRKFFDDFPNPFQTAKKQISTSSVPIHLTTIASLTDRKSKLRAQMGRCKAAQNEVNFEICISPLPPTTMKPISTRCMASLVQNTITLIGACENKFVVLGNYDRAVPQRQEDQDSEESGRKDEEESEQSSPPGSSGDQDGAAPARLSEVIRQHMPGKSRESKHKDKKKYLNRVENVKPLREIEASNANLLESVLARLKDPVQDFDKSFQEAVALLTSCIAYCFDVPKLPSGAPTPKGIPLEEIDLRIDSFTDSLALFSDQTTEELRQAAIDETGHSIDLMPRMETFLVSSFLLGYHQAATHILEMLRRARDLVEERRRRNDRSRIWLPHYTSMRQWLSSAGEWDGAILPSEARKSVRRGNDSKAPEADDEPQSTDHDHTNRQPDEETLFNNGSGEQAPRKRPLTKKAPKVTKPKRKTEHSNWLNKLRSTTADAIEWAQDSDDLDYALKLAIAVFLVSWPAFVTSWNAWYANIRGSWAPMQLVLVFEVVIGSSFLVFFVRLFGVIFGCAWGYLAYVIGGGNRAAMVAVLFFGIVPSVYIQLATKYVKAGMVSIISMSVVALGQSVLPAELVTMLTYLCSHR